IHGKVLGLQDAALREKVLPLIAGSLGRKLFKFTMQAGSAGVGDVSFRIAFGYPKGEQNDRLCTDKIPELAPEEKDITAIGALCNDGELLAEASGGLLLRR
ncbi:MAG: hypothetical protein QGF71_04765, partial [Rhodospirillales bacterium]|nr:hypothetical protein [Rhodospirillales bacterium]